MAKKANSRLGKTTIFWAGVGIFLAAIFIFSFYPSKKKLTLVIDYGGGNSRTFTTSYKEGFTAWDMLQQANANYQIDLEPETDFRPKSIGEFKNGTGGKHWVLYKNGQRQEASPIQTELSGGEIIRFRFE